MKAAILEDKGKPFVIKEVDRPSIGENEVLVQVKAAALNHRDVWIQQGQYAGLKYPIILGSDGAGIVSESLSGENQNVIINPSLHWGPKRAYQSPEFKILGLPDNGTFARYVKVPESNVVRKPGHLDFEAAAALPLAGLTAYRALFTRAKLQKDDTVLVTGIGGGVAQFVLQFAVAAGARVFVTSGSEEKIDIAKKWGAEGGAVYKDNDWDTQLKKQAGPFDVIIDGASGDGFINLLGLADYGGRIVVYGGTAGPIQKMTTQRLFWKQINLLGSTMGSPDEFMDMVRFVEEHKIKPKIDEVFPLDNINDAVKKMREGKQTGKLVLKL